MCNNVVYKMRLASIFIYVHIYVCTEKNSAFLLTSKSSSHCTVTQSSQCAERALSLLLGSSANAFLRLGGAPHRLALRVHSERSSDCSLKGSGYSYGSTTYSDEKYRVYRSKLALPVYLRGSYCAQFFSMYSRASSVSTESTIGAPRKQISAI